MRLSCILYYVGGLNVTDVYFNMSALNTRVIHGSAVVSRQHSRSMRYLSDQIFEFSSKRLSGRVWSCRRRRKFRLMMDVVILLGSFFFFFKHGFFLFLLVFIYPVVA